jgi:hypothetical protein
MTYRFRRSGILERSRLYLPQFGQKHAITWFILTTEPKPMVIGSDYFRRQAATLLRIAKATTDSARAAALVQKAAEYNSQTDETMAPMGCSSLPVEIEHQAPLAPEMDVRD